MNVTIAPELEKFVAEQVNSGAFRSAEDIVAQSLGMLRAQEEFIRSNAAELKEAIAVGLEQIRRREVVDGRTALENIREKLRRREREGK